MGKLSNSKLIPISVTQHAHTTIIVYKELADRVALRIATSSDGIGFKLAPHPVVITKSIKNEEYAACDNFRLSVVNDEYIFSYEKKTGNTRTGIKKEIVFARSNNLKKFTIYKVVHEPKTSPTDAQTTHVTHSGFIVPTSENKYAFYFGYPNITTAVSADLESWKTNNALLIAPRSGFFDHGSLSPIGVHSIPEGIAVLYQTYSYNNGKEQVLVGGALFAHDNPQKILWRSEGALWEHEYGKTESWNVCGAIFKKDSILIYLGSKNGDLSVVAIPNRFHMLGKKKVLRHPAQVVRHKSNPIIKPTPQHEWQSQATFNAAAVEADGRIHLIYRAMGGDGVSRLGQTSSEDGAHFDEYYPDPIYEPTRGFGMPDIEHTTGPRRYDPISTHPAADGPAVRILVWSRSRHHLHNLQLFRKLELHSRCGSFN